MTLFSAPNVRLLLVLGIAILASYGARRNRPRSGSRTLAAFMLALAVVVASHLAAHLSADPASTLFIKLRWTGLFSLPFFVFAFALSYTGRGEYLSRRGVAALFAFPTFVAAVIWAPTVGIEVATGVVSSFSEEAGPLYLSSVLGAYAVLFAATALLLYHSFQVHRRFRQREWVLVAGLAVVWGGTSIEVFDLVGGVHVHWVQSSFLVLGLAVLWVVYRGDVTDLAPVARSTIIRDLDVAVLVVDDERKVTDINPAAERLLGVEDDRVIGRTVAEAFPDRDGLLEGLRREGGTEIELPTDDGERYVSTHVTALTGARGEPIGRTVLLYDTTERRRQREQLRRQNERLDEFAGVVSHDLRNPLSVAGARIDLAAEECDSEHLEEASRALGRMETIIDDVLSLARVGETVGETEPVELSELIDACWRNVETASARVVPETDATVRADRTQLQQLLENLFRNAIEHAGEDATIAVGDLPDGFYVEDDGPGIPADDREDVFEPGYTTSEEGTGFGLSIVRDIAAAHGWDVAVVSGDDGGARFEFTGVRSG